jgi:hypothetical protein
MVTWMPSREAEATGLDDGPGRQLELYQLIVAEEAAGDDGCLLAAAVGGLDGADRKRLRSHEYIDLAAVTLAVG